MKIHQGSDFHLEFGRDNLAVPGGADLLILNGDIIVAQHIRAATSGIGWQKNKFGKLYKRYKKFFEECSAKYEHVIFVLGNHEHYYFRFQRTAAFLKSWFKQLGLLNIQVLNSESTIINGIKFFGATLWTDMRKSDPMIMWDVRRNMNDCKSIIYRDASSDMYGECSVSITPQDMVKEHEYSLQRLIEELSSDHPTVVISHHGPSYQSIPSWYAHDNLSFAYTSNLDDLILSSENILMWFHGHTHTPFRYMIGQVPIICNPRGYFGIEGKKEIRKYTMTELEIELGEQND